MGLPAVRSKPWYAKEKWPAWIGVALGGLASGILFFKEVAAEPVAWWGLAAAAIACVSAVGLGVLRIAQATYRDAKTDQVDSPAELRGALHVLHKVVAGHKNVELSDGQLRATLYRVDGESLEQSVKYVGWSAPQGNVGRKLPVRSGVIGLVARTKEPKAVHRSAEMPYEEWAGYLVRTLGMTEETVKGTRLDRYSFLGIPIKSGGQVIAVVYLDASDRDFFDESTVQWCISACEGLALWIRERYYRDEGLV